MFDKEKFYRNITYLAKKQKIQMSELEDLIGVSRGYISKLAKPNSPMPAIDYIIKLAEKLKVSIDTLVNGDLEHLSPKEQYVYDFVHKLKKLTEIGKLDWVRERVINETDVNGSPYYRNENGDSHLYFYPEFVDKFVLAEDAVYVARLPQSSNGVMLININYKYELPEGDTDYFEAIEIYTVDKNGSCNPVCNSDLTVEELKNEINELNSYVFGARSRLGLNDSAKMTISNFLNNIDDEGELIQTEDDIMKGFTDDSIDEELPFT